MKKQSRKTAFSLLELAITTLIVSFLLAGVFAGKKLVYKANLKGAQGLTKSSQIQSIPDLKLWLEPTLDESLSNAAGIDGSLSENDEVASWNDISGNGILVTQSNSSDRPTYIEYGINNLPALRFSSSNVIYSTTAPIDAGNKKYTMVVVWKSLSLPTCVLLEQKRLTSVVNTNAAIVLNFSNIRFSAFQNNSGTIYSISINKPYIFVLTINDLDSINGYGYLNSNSAVTASTSISGNLNVGNAVFSVGARTEDASYTKSFPCDAQISEVMVFNRNLNPSEVQIINSYLSKKYNITLS